MLSRDRTIIYADRVLHLVDGNPGRFELIDQVDVFEWAALHEIAVDCINPHGAAIAKMYEFAPITETQRMTIRLRWH